MAVDETTYVKALEALGNVQTIDTGITRYIRGKLFGILSDIGFIMGSKDPAKILNNLNRFEFELAKRKDKVMQREKKE